MTSRVEQLRRAFDDAFAEPVSEQRTALEQFLAIGVGQRDQAVRLREIDGLFAGRKVVPVPSSMPELAGLVGLRGTPVPVYSLELLLGQEAAPERPRWFLVAGGVGFAFSRFDGYVQALKSDVIAGTSASGIAHETLQIADTSRPIVTLAALLERIRARVRAQEHKE